MPPMRGGENQKGEAMKDIYQTVTDRIIERIEAGEIPWDRGWQTDGRMPANAVSGHQYQGVNVMTLWAMRYESPFWLTFNQAKSLGGSVKKGEKASPVVFWKFFDREDEDGKAKRIPMLKSYCVFNIAQCEGIPADKLPEAEEAANKAFSPLESAEAVVGGYQGGPKIEIGYQQACYSPTFDTVQMPSPESFVKAENYYSTLFHELIHSTGHKDRLNRDKGGSFADEKYSREELIAEMGAAFLNAHCGLDIETETRSAAYLQGWLKVLKADPKALIVAGGAAQKAANLILGKAPALEAVTAEGAAV